MRAALACLAALLLTPGCAPEPLPATPALWQVESPQGEKGWLFGTIHALDRPVDWQGPKVNAALAQSGTLVVELIERDAQDDPALIFAQLSRSSGLPALEDRVSPPLRIKLEQVLSDAGTSAGQFADVETWAAALTLARMGADAPDPALGVDKALRDQWRKLGLASQQAAKGPIRELEGTRGQLGIFDSLPEKEQRDLLNAVLRDHGNAGDQLALAWRKGDMATITREAQQGMLADPELREALLTRRNRSWADQVEGWVNSGSAPFVAAGAAHMAGPEGLPALLAARGFKVTRVQ